MDQPPRIRVPKTPREAYNPHRPLSKNSLLEGQVLRFHEIEKEFPPEHHIGIPVESIKTEAQAADYIGRVTRKVHQLHERKSR